MPSILVTGGAGFIGGHFVRQWIAEEADAVVNLDKLTYAGNLDSLASLSGNPRHTFVEGDIGDFALVSQLLETHRPWAVVHFAAETHVDRSIDAAAAFVETNVVGTFRLLEAARAYRATLDAPDRQRFRFLHVSTDEVYGSLDDGGRSSETSPYAPNSPYAASKAAADHFARAYHRTHGLPVLITNCSNNYGPRQFPEKLIPLVTLAAIDGRRLPVYGDGGQVRDWLHVEDHCRAVREVLSRGTPGEVYNIGGNSGRSNLDVVRSIAEIVDRLRPELPHRPCASLIEFVTDRPGHDRRYATDTTKIATQLGWRPQVDFQTGLEQTVRWYLENPKWIARVTTGKYHGERIGLGG